MTRIDYISRGPLGRYNVCRRLGHMLIGSALAISFTSSALTAGKGDIQSSNKGIWISPAEILELPDTGAAWDEVVTHSKRPVTPNIADQSDPSNIRVLAKALVAVRTDSEQLRNEVRAAIADVQGTENGARSLAIARELMAYIVSAELVGLSDSQRTEFSSWLRSIQAGNFQGRTLRSTHEDRPNNWGTHAGASRLALAIYLNDQDEVHRAAKVFRGYLGDQAGAQNFKFGALWWQPDNRTQNYGINPTRAQIGGHTVDGVLPDDQRRGGPFSWPPPKENYVYEALQGVVAQAVILERLGMPSWEWGNRAILRAFQWLHNHAKYPAEGDDTWLPYVVNRVYGTNFPTVLPSRPGKAIGFTDWTHGQSVP